MLQAGSRHDEGTLRCTCPFKGSIMGRFTAFEDPCTTPCPLRVHFNSHRGPSSGFQGEHCLPTRVGILDQVYLQNSFQLQYSDSMKTFPLWTC